MKTLLIKTINNGYIISLEKTKFNVGYVQPGESFTKECKREFYVETKSAVLNVVRDTLGIATRADLPEHACYSCARKFQVIASDQCDPQGELVNSPYYPAGCDEWEAK